MPKKQAVIEVYKQGKAFIVLVGHDDEAGLPISRYRLAGPKFDSYASPPVLRHVIDQQDAEEIRRYLPEPATSRRKNGGADDVR